MILSVIALGLCLGSLGCAHNAIVADGISRTDTYYGDVGVTGDGTTVTIQKYSKVSKLSLLGNNNMVTVEEGAVVRRIEFWGKGNTVSLPEGLFVRTTEVGQNQIIRRSRERTPIPEWAPSDTAYPPAEEPLYTEPMTEDWDTQDTTDDGVPILPPEPVEEPVSEEEQEFG
jgi:hypothetical protein